MGRFSIRTGLCGIATLLVVAANPAVAILIQFEPEQAQAMQGSQVTVDVVAAALQGEIVSAYDLDVTYDSSVLTATTVTFGPGLGDPSFFEVLEDFDVAAPGLVDLAQLSLLPDDWLLAMQGGDSVTLATIVFDAVGVGVSMLDFVFDAINDVKGLDGEVLPVAAGAGQVSVLGPSMPVDEPGSWTLVLIGAVSLLCVRRRWSLEATP